MTAATAPDGMVAGLDLLQRALDYTRDALGTITCADVDRPTPCAGWNLADLLAHMEDALDAFAEAADGAVGLSSAAPTPLEARVQALQHKACALLAAWLRADRPTVEVGGRPLAIDAIARIAALEIAVHGWDVGQATGCGAPLPEPLAVALLPSALQIALAGDDRFAPPLPVAVEAPAGLHVLALLGRRSSPPRARGDCS
ncbi:TIGR03086 family metal-binding protein [Nocardioides daeguensis]|uniref:Maleylpyruvate isomerase family mycothiol-dependent enzyme n=1 Tax=Nocardioides daeguensis TaxID=908359 RepID=A0ABP6WG66_9ACTN|nr:TIGR03086 family metal-binding protein [Nocardioides daeguensis]MBV6727940.1 TIGR03086 family protein [Nocardioides daeguensis]MCR1771683.1 TIGR03086 family protein [Nocardioides daeguensis]